MKVFLNNILLTDNEANLQDISISFEKQNVSNYTKNVSFYGWAYDLIYSELIDTPKGWLKTIPFRVERTCCGGGVVFEGLVRGDQIDWTHNECIVTADISEETEERDGLRYLKSTLITEHLAESGHPWLFIPNGRGLAATAVQVFLYYIAIIVASLFRPIVSLIDTLSGSGSTLFEDYQALITNLSEQMELLLGQRPVMPYVREIITQGISPNGITFVSSILNNSSSEYFNSTYLSIISDPYTFSNPVGKINKINFPVRSIAQFLDELSIVFNAEWFLIGKVLHFERRDNLPFLPAKVISNQEDLTIDFNYKSDNKASYFDLQYTADSQEKGSSELLNSFNHIEEWNATASESQEGVFDVNIPFSPYASGAAFKSQAIQNLAIRFLSSRGITVNPNLETLELSDTYVYVPKIIPLTTSGAGWILDTGNQMRGGALYDNFYSIENPRESGFRGVNFSATFTADCDFIESVSGIRRIFLPYGNTNAIAYVNNIEIDYNSNQVTINGEL